MIKMLLPKNKYSLKAPYSMVPKYIVVHNTANDASAYNEAKFMINSNSSTSFHYAVDDKCVIQIIPENRNAFHAGDGRYGNGNRFGIGIEICYSKSGGERFIKAEDNAVDLIVYILKQYNWNISHVKKHQDFSGKYCPHRTLDMGWDRFLDKIKERMDGDLTMTQYEDLSARLKTLENKMVYNYIDNNMPEWARPTIQMLVDKGYLKGAESGLNLDDNMLRILVILDRAGAFK